MIDADSFGKMRGWQKLKETILQTDPPSNEPLLSTPNGHADLTPFNGTLSEQNGIPEVYQLMTSTNGYASHSLDIDQVNELSDSSLTFPPSPSVISLASSPRLINEDLQLSDAESSASSTVSKRSATVSRTRVKTPQSNMNQESTTGTTTIQTEDISDDDILLVDIHKSRTKSIEALAVASVQDTGIPLATDLLSLPGLNPDELRDLRFLLYSDTETLSKHLQICLSLDRETAPPFDFTRTRSSKTPNNCLHGVFHYHYLKTLGRMLQLDKKNVGLLRNENRHIPLSVINSSTAVSFQTEWSTNRRRSSSTRRHKPKNIFHILQLNPTTHFSSSDNPPGSSKPSTPRQANQNLERVKDILARTYYPHLYTSIECGYHFGFQSRFPSTQHLISTHDELVTIKEMPESPYNFEPSTTITLRTPPSSTQRRSNLSIHPPSPAMRKQFTALPTKLEDISEPVVSFPPIPHRYSEEADDSSPVIIKPSIVVLSQTSMPIPSPPMFESEVEHNPSSSRKRKTSTPTSVNIREKKKKRIVSSPSPPPTPAAPVEVLSEPEESEENHSPKQPVVKNGLRSNCHKATTISERKPMCKRRRRQSSGTRPPFYTDIIEFGGETSPHRDFRLPSGTVRHGQQQQRAEPQPSTASSVPTTVIDTAGLAPKKKKATQPKQKQPAPCKQIQRSMYADQLRQSLQASSSAEEAPVCDCKPPDTCEDGHCMNRMIYTECLPTCACGSKCSNQKIRKGQWFKHLEVFETSKYGQGLRTTSTISKGTFLCEYVGEVITEEKFLDRMSNIYSKDEHHYTMKLTQNLVIDAYRIGHVARFANHSCSPNCEFQKWTVDGLPRMCMFSLRTIKPGEELTYDYNFQSFNLQAQQPCYCESSKCRGVIGAKQQSVLPSTPASPQHQPNPNQKLTQREKRAILESSIFLLRNLRQIKEKQELRKKNQENKLKQQSTTAVFFSQNYYHLNRTNHKATFTSLRKTPKLPHKDIFYLFYNHIRRSHFAKTGRIHTELIDEHCYYAQLAQLALVLNEIFEMLLNYRGTTDVSVPANALRKCPSKRLFPAYYEIIKEPMDLALMRSRIDQGDYRSFDLFEQDFRLLIKNAITYCGENSDVAHAVLELEKYFLSTLKKHFEKSLNLFLYLSEEPPILTNLNTLEDFIARLHEREVRDGQVRQALYDAIFNITAGTSTSSPIVCKIVLANTVNAHRSAKGTSLAENVVHCRCGSNNDENSLVQCYACQLWQHVACASIGDSSQPYYCFECQPTCEQRPAECLKTNVMIPATLAPVQTFDDHHQSYSTLTREDGFVIRINECYFVPKQQMKNIDVKLTSPQYDILYVERLWNDDYGVGQAAGFYCIRPNETFHEPNRKFFYNEVFRFPSSNDPLPISCFVRPCYVFDIPTYCKGKPISDNSSRVLSSDIFICESRVDKTARTFSRLAKSKCFMINCKPYCFDSYVEKLTVKRTYQPHQKEIQEQNYHYDNRRRHMNLPNRLTIKMREEKHIRIDGIVEKICYLFHNPSAISAELSNAFSHHLLPQSSNDRINPRLHSRLNGKKSSVVPTGHSSKKRRYTVSASSDEDTSDPSPDYPEQKGAKKRPNNGTTVTLRKRDE